MVQALEDMTWRAEQQERIDILHATQEAEQLGWGAPGPHEGGADPQGGNADPHVLEEQWPDDDDWDAMMQVDGADDPHSPPRRVVFRSDVLHASQQAATFRGLAAGRCR